MRDDAAALAEDHLGVARVAAVALSDGDGQRGRLHLVDGHDAALGLADDLLGDHQHVALLDGRALGVGGVHDLGGQVVTGLDLGQALDSYGANFRRHGAPPVGALEWRGVSDGSSLSPHGVALRRDLIA